MTLILSQSTFAFDAESNKMNRLPYKSKQNNMKEHSKNSQ